MESFFGNFDAVDPDDPDDTVESGDFYAVDPDDPDDTVESGDFDAVDPDATPHIGHTSSTIPPLLDLALPQDGTWLIQGANTQGPYTKKYPSLAQVLVKESIGRLHQEVRRRIIESLEWTVRGTDLSPEDINSVEGLIKGFVGRVKRSVQMSDNLGIPVRDYFIVTDGIYDSSEAMSDLDRLAREFGGILFVAKKTKITNQTTFNYKIVGTRHCSTF